MFLPRFLSLASIAALSAGCAISSVDSDGEGDAQNTPEVEDPATAVRLEAASGWCAAGEPFVDDSQGISGVHCLAPLDVAGGSVTGEGVTWEAGPIQPVHQ
jgi:hypothetical protein